MSNSRFCAMMGTMYILASIDDPNLRRLALIVGVLLCTISWVIPD